MSRVVISVQSSFIESAVYNEENQSLRIGISGNWYYYYGITKQKAGRFRNSVSKGRYFCKYIKGQYKSIKRKAR